MIYRKLEQKDLDLTPEDTYQLLLNHKVDFIEISLCAGNSSITIKKGTASLVNHKDLDYNGELINQFRCVLQDIYKDERIRVLEESHTANYGVGKAIYKIEICSPSGKKQEYTVTSSGISNKYNRLTIEKKLSKKIQATNDLNNSI